jgi:DNA-binding response OmpR family regulator
MVVDDDPLFLRLVDRIVCAPNWHTLKSDSGAAALLAAAQHGGPIDLLLTDVVMPDLDGVALAACLREQQPQIRVLFMSGYGSEILARKGLRVAAEQFLAKPLSPTMLRARIRAALGETT